MFHLCQSFVHTILFIFFYSISLLWKIYSSCIRWEISVSPLWSTGDELFLLGEEMFKYGRWFSRLPNWFHEDSNTGKINRFVFKFNVVVINDLEKWLANQGKKCCTWIFNCYNSIFIIPFSIGKTCHKFKLWLHR